MDLKELTLLRGVSGNEQAVRRALIAAAQPLCDKVSLDKMGNVVAYKKGTDSENYPHIMLAAHMDEVGLVVISITDDGMLRVRSVGGVDPRVVISKRVLVGEKAVPGVIGATAIHLQTAEDRQRVMQFDSIYVDIGAKSKDDGAKDCPPGSYITFDTPYREFGDGYVCAKALDDRVGCYTMLRILQDTYPGDVTCLFTSEEEVGCRGAMGGTYGVKADLSLVLEGTTCNDLGDVPDTLQVCKAGKGVAISFMDNASIAHRPLYRAMLKTAEDKQISYQIKTMVSGGNDGGAIQRAGGGAGVVVLSVPCRYIHSPSSVMKLSDVETQYQLTRAFLQNPALCEE